MSENRQQLFHFEEVKKAYDKFTNDFANFIHIYEYSMIIDALKYYDAELLILSRVRSTEELSKNLHTPSQLLTFCYVSDLSASETRLENLFISFCQHIGDDNLPEEYVKNKKEYNEIFLKELKEYRKMQKEQIRKQKEQMEQQEALMLSIQKSQEEDKLDHSQAIEI